jgi:signal transduction histidine kinase
LLRLLGDLNSVLREARDVDAAVRHVVRACATYYDAQVALAASRPPYDRASVRFAVPEDVQTGDLPFVELIRGGKAPVPANVLYARVRRRERAWGVIVVRRGERFSQSDRRTLSRVASLASSLIREIDLRRIAEVRQRIDRKSMEKILPLDLAYHILDGLRSLTGYDHSAAILLKAGDPPRLEVLADQIAWRKGESNRVGETFAFTDALEALLNEPTVYGFVRIDGAWQEMEARPADALAELIQQILRDRAADEPPEMHVLCAPLRGRDGTLGLLKVSCLHAGSLGSYEAGLISAFLPQAALALHNAQRAEAFKQKLLVADRKHAMADLARGVSHDLRNALGSVIPLVQQMRQEAEEDSLSAATCLEDLRQIERSMEVCKRIFSRMLTFARRSAEDAVGHRQVRPAIEVVLGVLEDSLGRAGIRVTLELADDLPPVDIAPGGLEQVMLNLLSNARDAMPQGGAVRIAATPDAESDRRVRVVVEDNGVGIEPQHLPHVLEPFFSTKGASGTGLGLSTCRNIVWEVGGRIDIDSGPGRGTRVTLLLPAAQRDRGPGGASLFNA